MKSQITDSNSNEPYQVGVATAAFVFCEGKFLIHRRMNALGADTWGPPGGKLDFGESPEQGIEREIREETGLSIGQIRNIGYTNDLFESEGKQYVTLWFVATSPTQDSVIVEPHKCTEQKWITLSELPSGLFFPTENILKNNNALKIIKELSA